LTTEVAYKSAQFDVDQLAALSNGEFAIDYDTGRIRYCKATTGTSDTCNYTSRQMNIEITAGGNVTIGDVKVTDGTETANVTASNELNVLDSNSADIKTSVELIDDTIGTIDTAFSGKVSVNGAKAESTVPTEVADADAVALWVDTFGRQIVAGFNQAIDSLDVNDVSPALLQTSEQTLLSAVTSTGASSDFNVLNYNKMTFFIVASSVTDGGTMKIQSSPDGTNYYDEDAVSVIADGVTKIVISEEKHKYVRANLTARTDGTYSVFMIAGN